MSPTWPAAGPLLPVEPAAVPALPTAGQWNERAVVTDPKDAECLAVLKVKLEAQRELFAQQLAASKEALRLQAGEYERRLELLNGEASRLREMQALYIPREVYEASQKELRASTETLAAKALQLSGERSSDAATISRLEAGLTWLTRTVVAAILALLVAAVSGYFGRR